MGLRIGINPITWTNDDMPELGGDIPLETCLAEARLAGYLGMELGNKFPRRAAELKPILDRHGLKLVSGWYSAHLLERSVADEIAAIEDHLTLLAGMGCGVMVFAEGSGAEEGRRDVPLSRRPVLPAGDWTRYGEAVTAVARHTAARGVQVAFHHHMGTIVETDSADGGVTGPESGPARHRASGGSAPAGRRPRHHTRIVHVHCRTCARPCWSGRGAATRASATPCSTASSRCRATVPSTSRRSSASSRNTAIAAGWWSRPSRTRPRRTR
jgi:inosose dehydratase